MLIFKDQVIVVLNNELQKLRKELSDLSIVNGYENAPIGRCARYQKKLDMSDDANTANDDDDYSSQIELEKTFFLNDQLCNYSDEDKINDMLKLYNSKNLPDVALSFTENTKDSLIISDPFFTADCSGPMSDDDYKSMTPDSSLIDGEPNCPDKVKRLEGELEKYKENFEREKLKWIEEKEKVLAYQRQLQANYLEMSKRTQVLEEKLRKVEKN
jgi:hypothetical protein